MSAPTSTPRQVPTGFKLPDGYQTMIAFSLKPAIQLWEKTVRPFGLDNGEPIDTTTMLNQRWRTKGFRKLTGNPDVTMSCAYDPDVATDIEAIIGVNQAITVWLPDDSNWAFWGALVKWEPQEHQEGAMPMVNVTIGVSNWDSTAGVEAGPVFTAAAGT